MLKIQPYQEDKHWVSLMEIFTEIFDKSEVPYVEEFQTSNLSYVCTARTGSVQGFILVRPSGPNAIEIAYLGIVNRYRKQGYARRLVDTVRNSHEGCGLWLHVLDINKEACAMYHKLGFDASARFTSEIGEAATKFTLGLYNNCYHCSKQVKPSETIWEDTPTTIGFNRFFHQNYEKKPVCWHCRTRVES